MTPPIQFNHQDILVRLRERTVYRGDCWLYRATSAGGYGQIKIGNKFYYVHRLSAHIFLALDINDRNQHALHKKECPYKYCWNWNHLYVGDNCDNMKDLRLRRVNEKLKQQHTTTNTQPTTTEI